VELTHLRDRDGGDRRTRNVAKHPGKGLPSYRDRKIHYLSFRQDADLVHGGTGIGQVGGDVSCCVQGKLKGSVSYPLLFLNIAAKFKASNPIKTPIIQAGMLPPKNTQSTLAHSPEPLKIIAIASVKGIV
jgi:hypothetical protein